MRHKNIEGTTRKLKGTSLGVATLLALAFSISTVSAQESISATGGNVSGSGGSVSYSIGQFAYQTHTGRNGSVSQGVQQPFEISTVTSIEEAKGIILSVSAYPNPTAGNLTLEVKDFELSTLSFQLYDMNGKLLQNERITGNQTIIVMSNLVPSTYFIKVVDKAQSQAAHREVKTFRIIKN